MRFTELDLTNLRALDHSKADCGRERAKVRTEAGVAERSHKPNELRVVERLGRPIQIDPLSAAARVVVRAANKGAGARAAML